MKTNATLTLQCPGYSGIRINNTQAMKKREDTTNKCRDVVSNLIRLWARFTRI
ncbi:Thymic stromal lymphopoietin [Pteropus alecto]|uniref:Thymic stromal lymphopoietin n=1 Tax=Pteropus alecto TaxID=9402 RepID=L5KIR5_PTEAL|nr:Thymic stromal lymphopoietin [Pteropus alecto]